MVYEVKHGSKMVFSETWKKATTDSLFIHYSIGIAKGGKWGDGLESALNR